MTRLQDAGEGDLLFDGEDTRLCESDGALDEPGACFHQNDPARCRCRGHGVLGSSSLSHLQSIV